MHRSMTHGERSYVPAAGQHWRLPFYDLMASLFGADGARRVLVEQFSPAAGERLLDLGTGTGSLAIAIKRRHAGVDLTGIDPDPRALAMARRKADRAAVAIRLDRGFADALPYPDGTFDRVVSSLVFHHLAREDKPRALAEVRRVLKPGGRFHMLDFDGPDPARKQGFVARHLQAHPMLREGAAERVLGLMATAGFDARIVERRAGRLTRLAYYEAIAPA